jgi:hypothetical protein
VKFYEQLRDSLATFIAASATRDAGNISAALNRVLELEAKLPADAPDRLRHFLQRRSYQKALEFLNAGCPPATKKPDNTAPSTPAATTRPSPAASQNP